MFNLESQTVRKVFTVSFGDFELVWPHDNFNWNINNMTIETIKDDEGLYMSTPIFYGVRLAKRGGIRKRKEQEQQVIPHDKETPWKYALIYFWLIGETELVNYAKEQIINCLGEYEGPHKIKLYRTIASNYAQNKSFA